MSLLKYIKNRNRVKEPYPCLKVLGSKAAVSTFAKFWEHNADDLMTAFASKLLKYSESEEYTKEEFVAYRAGLTAMSTFFLDCWTESELYKNEIDKHDKI